MPVRVTYPGVYIQEVPSGVRTITGVSTSVAAFVGMVQRGRLNTPTNVLSFADYERAFGSDTSRSEMTDQVRLFFQNGGQSAYIMRIAKNATQAAVTVDNEFGAETLKFAAKDFGLIGESVRFTVDYDTAQPESTFNMTVFREMIINGALQFVEMESHTDLSTNPNAGRYVKTVLDRDSALLTVLTPNDDSTAPDPQPALFAGYTVASTLLSDINNTTLVSEAVRAADPGALLSQAVGRFEISVDGRAYVLVSLPESGLNDATIQTAINNALVPTGTSVSVNLSRAVAVGGPAYFQIASTVPGGSVRIRRALRNDIAGLLGLGTANGGLEIDGYAIQRPAPTGRFSRLGSTDLSTLDTLSQFLQAENVDVANITLTDSVNGTSPAVSPAYVGTVMWNRQVADDTDLSISLRNGRDNLDAIAAAINNSSDIRWNAHRQGYRLVLRPEFGDADTDTTATLTASSDDAIGNDTTGIFGNASNVSRYRLGGYLDLGNYANGSQAGDDGLVPDLTEYKDAFETIDREVDIFNLLLLPQALDQNGNTIDVASLWGPASIFCQARRAFLLIDPPEDWRTVQEARDGVEDLRIGLVKDHAAVYWPRLRMIDPTTGALRIVNVAGAMAGVYARTDSNRGVWKAPAGLNADIRGIRGLEYSVSDPENGLTNPAAVNTLRIFANGIVSWGARTMDGFDNSGNDDYKYVPVRRLALFIEESLYRGLKWAVFEPNDEPLWAQIRLAAGAFMNNLFRQGAFQGQKARDAYFVKVDSETTTQNDINLGIVNVVVGFAPLKPAEFVVITIQQMAGQVQT